MGHHQRSGSGHGIGPHNFSSDRHCDQRIQFTGWLIVENNLRFHHQCPSNGYPFLHTARKFRRILQGILRPQVHQRQFLLNDPLNLCRGFQAMFRQIKANIFTHRQ